MIHISAMKNINFTDVQDVFNRPLMNLVLESSGIHSKNFPDHQIQASALLSIKTGGCPENCSYCPQSAHYKTGVDKTKLMQVDDVVAAAEAAKQSGASRFCMGAAWREIKDGPEFDQVLEMITQVKSRGLEVCCTLGMLNEDQSKKLKQAGLDFYNHNIDTSRAYYEKVIQTRTYDDRLNTLAHVRSAGVNVCTGGILGMGESEEDRIAFVQELVQMQPQPESITINTLVPTEGTPLAEQKPVDAFDVLRVIATLRILAPKSMIRLSAGRMAMSNESQFLCFLAGANSIFLGEKLLTSPNPLAHDDWQRMDKFGLKFSPPSAEIL
ncbi:MAG: biotin synthase BioB [Pseudobdellovibrionaceae bacterium]